MILSFHPLLHILKTSQGLWRGGLPFGNGDRWQGKQLGGSTRRLPLKHLDWTLLALETFQLQVKPDMREGGGLKVRGGRHPLQELSVNQFIANDTKIGEDSARLHLLTGPNSSGKSVYLKQVFLIIDSLWIILNH